MALTPWEFRTKRPGRRPQDHGSRQSGQGSVNRRAKYFGLERRLLLARLHWDAFYVPLEGWQNRPEPTQFWTRAQMAATVPQGRITYAPKTVPVQAAPPAAPSPKPQRPDGAPVITAGELNQATRRGNRGSQAPVGVVTRDQLLLIARRSRNQALVEQILAQYAPDALIPVPAQ